MGSETADREGSLAQATARLGPGPLDEAGVQQHLRPLFARSLANGLNYLVGHSLGRPLDQTALDLAEGARVWAEKLRGAWEPWLGEEARFRASVAGLLGLATPGLLVPKLDAGAALRAVLNTLPGGATVLTTEDEFAAASFVLAQYAGLGRIQVLRVSADMGRWRARCFEDALGRKTRASLVVVSHCFYRDGQIFEDLPELARACHAQGTRLLVDGYHSVGAFPVDMPALGCDYLLGGCYKYLRGGPGLAFLALAPWISDEVRPLDAGWFAQEPGTDPWQPGGPALLPGGDGWLGGSPAVLTYYQVRAGLGLTLAIGVDRLRDYSLEQLGFLKEALAERGIASEGGDAEHGAFLTVLSPRAQELVGALARENIVVDERGGRLRMCPDLITTRTELAEAASALARCWR